MEADVDAGKPLPVSRRQIAWLLFCRILVTALFLGGTLVYHVRGGSENGHAAHSFLYLLFTLTFIHALASGAILTRLKRPRLFLHGQFSWDLIFCALLIYLSGGIDSLFSFLFILVILAASAFLPRRDVFFVASAAAILYGSLLDLQYYHYLPFLNGVVFSDSIDARDVFFAVFVNVSAFFLTALLSGLLAERLRRSEQALEKRKIDLGELETLNRAILANTPSGLLIINQQGKVRSFNSAATRITGLSLQEVYNRNVCEIFPSLPLMREGEFLVFPRGEGSFTDNRGVDHVLGYATSLLKGSEDNIIGLLVTFQDLTQLKQMEEELKRTDKLAAVGRLASGMAHEIRNPLASISGSVQLLMEGENVSEDDRRLMGIVVKEADRLSGLLSDFLVFARPAKPRREMTEIDSLVNDIVDMASCDRRFTKIQIQKSCSEAFWMEADPQQLHQAIWNLVINAAEAMEEKGGTLCVGTNAEAHEVFVEDTGKGIPQTIRNQIFDPFFTTKDRGTGLGLATVHSIVDAHGGYVSVTPVFPHGTRFTVCLARNRSTEKRDIIDS